MKTHVYSPGGAHRSVAANDTGSRTGGGGGGGGGGSGQNEQIKGFLGGRIKRCCYLIEL